VITIAGPLAGLQLIMAAGMAGLLLAVIIGAVSEWRGRAVSEWRGRQGR
jgi:hypothetical protein